MKQIKICLISIQFEDYNNVNLSDIALNCRHFNTLYIILCLQIAKSKFAQITLCCRIKMLNCIKNV